MGTTSRSCSTVPRNGQQPPSKSRSERDCGARATSAARVPRLPSTSPATSRDANTDDGTVQKLAHCPETRSLGHADVASVEPLRSSAPPGKPLVQMSPPLGVVSVNWVGGRWSHAFPTMDTAPFQLVFGFELSRAKSAPEPASAELHRKTLPPGSPAVPKSAGLPCPLLLQ